VQTANLGHPHIRKDEEHSQEWLCHQVEEGKVKTFPRSFKKMLPQEGEEAGACAEAVVGIAGEVAAEHFFFVEEAEDDQRDDQEEARERPTGAKRKRREEQHENSAEVHGMAD